MGQIKVDYYKFSIKYMIGDADGKVKEKVEITGDNPFVYVIADALNELEPAPGHWGITLQESDYKFNLDRKIISKKEYDLLCLVSESEDKEKLISFCKENNLTNVYLADDQLQEFSDAFRTDTESSFLTFQSCKVKIVR